MKELMRNTYKLYGLDNWDSDRLGARRSSLRSKVAWAVKSILLKRRIAVVPQNIEAEVERLEILGDTIDGLCSLYDMLEDDHSRTTLVKVVAYRILGHTKVKLPVNTPDYWRRKDVVLGLIKGDDTINIDFMNWVLNRFDLRGIGVPMELYSTSGAILRTFLLKQYECGQRHPGIKAEPGDYVIDAGGCWGDTGLYFANEVGENGRVLSFEFVPSNMVVMRRNLDLNPAVAGRIEVVEHPLWSESNMLLFCHDNGPGSEVSNQRTSERDFQVGTLSIDDFTRQHKIPRVDFIKMDIEGAELSALQGASETIRRRKPKLAIALYHSMNDLVDIPEFVRSLGLNYRFYLDHFSIHREETILFANPE